MFKDAKIGDRLYSVEDGWGIVEAINTSRIYPLTMKFDFCVKSFTLEGRRYIGSQNPTLFWDKIEFEIPKRPLPDLKVDTPVFVWNEKGMAREKKYFKEFNEDGKIVCFYGGATSWSYNGLDYEWNFWELAEDNTGIKEVIE